MSLLLWVLAIVVLTAIVILVVSISISYFLTRRSFLREPVNPSLVGLPYEDVLFKASDGVDIHGWWVPVSGTDRVIIQMHGHGGSMDPDLQYVPAWHEAGYNVLLFDFRAHGRSGGNLVTFGYLERWDVVGAVNFVRGVKGMKKIALVGFSLGGMVAILAAPLCPEVRAVVVDGAPVRIRSALTVWGIEHHLPIWLARALAWMAIFGASLRLRANLFRFEPIHWVSQIAPNSLMIIHGELDQYLPDFDQLLLLARPACLWRLPGVGHTQASQVYPEEYRSRILTFLNERM